jgi:alpha-1,2-mannosyltransferase
MYEVTQSHSQVFSQRSTMSNGPWWMLGGIFIIAFMARDYMVSSGGVIEHSAFWGRDFINVWTGGHLIQDGHIGTLYDLRAYAEYQRSLFGDIGPHNYSYPPVSFPLAVAFSLLPYPLALGSWVIGTGALFIWAARPWWPKNAGPVWLAVLTPAALVNIWAGHYGFLVGALFLLGWRRLDDRPVQAGIFFGLLLIKPHLAIFIPLALLIRGDWRAIASAAATVCVLILATGLWYGWAPWQNFLFGTSGVQAGMIDAGHTFFGIMSCSAATAVLRIGAGWPIAIAVQLAFAVAAIAMVCTAASRRVSTANLALIVATATFLLLPYSFNYDLTVVMIAALSIWPQSQYSHVDRRLALYGFLSPQIGMVLSAFYVPVMPLMLAGLGAAQMRIALAATIQRRSSTGAPMGAA